MADIFHQVEAALANALASGSTGVTWYNTTAPAGVATPFGVYYFVNSSSDDTVTTQNDELIYDIRVVDDAQAGMNSALAAGSIAGKARAVLSGAGALNVTGSLSGYACTELRRVRRIRELDPAGFWHVGDQWVIRISK